MFSRQRSDIPLCENFCRQNHRIAYMIALAGRLRSSSVFGGHDRELGPCATRLAPVRAQASGVSRGKQATVVHRQGSSRTTTYYTYQRAPDSPRASTVQLEITHQEDGGVCSSPDVDPAGAEGLPEVGKTNKIPASGSDSPAIPLIRNINRAVRRTDLRVKADARVPRPDVKTIQDNGASADPAKLAAFLCDRGFSGLQAEKLALELHGENSKLTSVRVLEHQLRKLESILPGMDIRALIVKDSLVLSVDAMTAARRLVLLDSQLGHPDLTQLVKTAPQLLYAEEVEDRLEHCLSKLIALLPDDYPLESLQKLLVEAPTIIFRMDYYVSASCLSDLPSDMLHQLNGMRGGPHDTSCMI